MAATSSYRDCFAEKFNDCSGYVRSVENAFLLLREFETATTSRFVVEQATSFFGNTGLSQFQNVGDN